jgi:hypothetical protein
MGQKLTVFSQKHNILVKNKKFVKKLKKRLTNATFSVRI